MLYLVDEITYFQRKRWLKDNSTKRVQDQLWVYSKDMYLRFSNIISANTDKQLITRELK